MTNTADTSAYKIGQLAAVTGCSVETIRYYEKEGLLPAPPRTGANYRLYGAAHAARLRFIRHCRSIDITLGEIRSLLDLQDTPGSDCQGVNTLLDRHIDSIALRISELAALQDQLLALRAQCSAPSPVNDCGILRGLGGPKSGA